jgi:hypothetical protein
VTGADEEFDVSYGYGKRIGAATSKRIFCARSKNEDAMKMYSNAKMFSRTLILLRCNLFAVPFAFVALLLQAKRLRKMHVSGYACSANCKNLKAKSRSQS